MVRCGFISAGYLFLLNINASGTDYNDNGAVHINRHIADLLRGVMSGH